MEHENPYNANERTYKMPEAGDVIKHATAAIKLATDTKTKILFETPKGRLVTINPHDELEIIIEKYNVKMELPTGKIAKNISNITSQQTEKEKG